MKFEVIYDRKYVKEFKKLDKSVQKMINGWIEKNLIDCEDPRVHGKALSYNYSGYWRYRVGNYRLVAEIRDSELVILMVDVGHRSEIYRV